MKKFVLFSACALVAFSLLLVSCSDDDDDSTPAEMGTINGHDYVDLGLSVKWATCNVGASSPSAYGNYYAWGETMTKTTFSQANCTTYDMDITDIAGNDAYDVARAIWGSTWRMPTADEIDEIIDKCQWEWITQDGHNGCKVTGTNGNSIFLPAPGSKSVSAVDGRSLSNNVGEWGYYWSATSKSQYSGGDGYLLAFGSGHVYRSDLMRSNGLSVRPVSK